MPVIDTSTLCEGVTLPENEQIYNGLDVCITHEVLNQLRALGPSPRIYNFTRALQAPVLDMMQRGFLIDTYERQKGIETLEKERERLLRLLNRFAYAVWDAPLNANSPQMLKAFFYDAMHLPEVWTSKKGERKLSLDREALEKLDNYFHARPLVSTILAIRDVTKQLSVLRTEVDSDGRMRTSYNVAGTECISGDSLVWTKSGLREIKDIYEATKPCAVWNGAEFVIPARKVKYENREGFAIVLENGYELKCSSNHPLMTQDGWKEARHLSLSDTIQINVGLTEKAGQACLPSNSILPLLSEDFCEFIGMWLADGSLNSTKEHYRCRLSNSSPQVLIHFAALTKRLFNIEANLYENEVCFSSKKVAQWLASLGLPADSGLGSATIKVIPKCILRGTPNLLRALLRGLTLDSHLTDKGLMYGTQSLKMQDQIQQCLLTLGLTSSKLKTGNSIKLNVNRASCGRFLGMIGFVEPEKAKALAVSLNWRGQWHEPYSFGQKPYLQIKSITSWKGDVYDLSMPETSPPQYVAQGFTIHNTGRFSSSTNAFGSGTNLQNISSNLRKMFVADRGYKLCGIDLEQAESREVGWLSGTICGDWSYLDACYSGDLHTLVARTAWPELPWTGDAKGDRRVAETPFYRHLTYRDMAKKLGHGSNYFGQPPTMAKHAKIPVAVADHFQRRYFRQFPGISKWHRHVAQQLHTTQSITTPFGRQRTFFGRAHDDATLREAIAFSPQSATADRLNLIMWRVWKNMPHVQLLAQIHDAFYVQYKETADETAIVEELLSYFTIPFEQDGHLLIVPGEAKVGFNWGNYDATSNPDGLIKWKGKKDERKRTPILQQKL